MTAGTPALQGVIVEGYLAHAAAASELGVRARRAAAQLSAAGDPIELLITISVPADQIALLVFSPATEAIAGRLVERAGLAADRIVACAIETEPRR